ncbi:exosortase/archaeosortase family protein [Marinobacter salinisoli]|uniref:Exosortase/archaeosortase family protein n=1 Tax=Marinobacter salinisoli TaxID=2769486 RepID=A0ABX7MQ53_9GAMM|nr:exosortase/archaeosortase family protein [Marinobacter salinisoli]QSP93530.1 exosortase/archaeosortase family protein [Marinobacter salinisoli]
MLRKTLDNLPGSRPYLIVTAMVALLFYPTSVRLGKAWLEFEQVLAHGLATAAIFLALLLIHPPKFSNDQESTKPYRPAGALMLIATTMIWALLELVRLDTLTYLMLPTGLAAMAWALLGLPAALAFIPHVLLFSLSLPIWADIVPFLVELASIVVGSWVNLLGMTALIEGNSITLPYGRMVIADGCSGIRYFAISILLAMMTSILNDYRWRGWLITLVIAATIGLVANWVRITILVAVGYETHMQSELVRDHETMGWIVYGCFILPALYFSPVQRRASATTLTPQSPIFTSTSFIAVALAIAFGPLALSIVQRPSQPATPWTLELPRAMPTNASNFPIVLDLPQSLSQKAWRAGDLWILLAQSQKSTADEKLVPYLPRMFDTSKWQLQETVEPGLRRYRNIKTNEQVIAGQWFQIGSHRGWTYKEAKLLQIPALLAQEKQFGLIALQNKCAPRNCDMATESVQHAMTSIRLAR